MGDNERSIVEGRSLREIVASFAYSLAFGFVFHLILVILVVSWALVAVRVGWNVPAGIQVTNVWGGIVIFFASTVTAVSVAKIISYFDVVRGLIQNISSKLWNTIVQIESEEDSSIIKTTDISRKSYEKEMVDMIPISALLVSSPIGITYMFVGSLNLHVIGVLFLVLGLILDSIGNSFFSYKYKISIKNSARDIAYSQVGVLFMIFAGLMQTAASMNISPDGFLNYIIIFLIPVVCLTGALLVVSWL